MAGQKLRTIKGSAPDHAAEITACAVCGCEWFDLSRDGAPGSVTLDDNGHVTGYAGELTCNECGTPVDSKPRAPLGLARS